MSTRVKIYLFLISVSNLINHKKMKEIFGNCCEQLGYEIKNNTLLYDRKPIGNLKIGQVITVKYSIPSFYNKLNKLRDLFTKEVEIYNKNAAYKYEQNKKELQRKKEIMEQYEYDLAQKQLQKEKEKIEMEQMALKKQKMDHNEALREELCQQAQNLGYEVNYETKDNGSVNIQLVKHDY